ncbi:MAG: TAXI family TRAP transporter solute-binding subunit, partial [Alphaproteobacteria bacterium]
ELQVVPTAGSGDNLALLDSGAAQLAMVQGIHTRPRAGASAAAAALADLRSITMLWPDIVHVVLRADLADTGTIQDIARLGAAPIAIGRPDSGAMLSTTALLVSVGIEPAHLNVVDVGGYDAIAQAFESGQIMAGSLLGGAPMAALTRAMSGSDGALMLLSFKEEQITAANARFGVLWMPRLLPAGTYPGQDRDVSTIAEPNALIARADMPEEDVYLLTKAIFSNLTFLGNMHPAAAEITIEGAFAGMAIPLHPGAARYFAEIGLAIPEALQPPVD